MVTASIALLAVGVCFFIGAFILLSARKQTGDPIYIDTSGITKNDSKNYIDIWRGKTFNVKVNEKFDIVIGDIPFIFGIRRLERIASIYTSLNDSIKLEIDQTSKDIIISKVFDVLVNEIYEICYPFTKNKFGLKKAINQKAEKEMMWMLSVCEELTDYWRVTEKKLSLLARGETLRETGGQMFTWDSLKVDATGKILILG